MHKPHKPAAADRECETHDLLFFPSDCLSYGACPRSILSGQAKRKAYAIWELDYNAGWPAVNAKRLHLSTHDTSNLIKFSSLFIPPKDDNHYQFWAALLVAGQHKRPVVTGLLAAEIKCHELSHLANSWNQLCPGESQSDRECFLSGQPTLPTLAAAVGGCCSFSIRCLYRPLRCLFWVAGSLDRFVFTFSCCL